MNIIIDAMGGDNAPGEILRGAAGAVREYGIEVTAVGDSAAIEAAAGHHRGACQRGNLNA